MSAPEKRNRNNLKVVSTVKSEPATSLVSPEPPPAQAECPFCFGTGMEVVPGDGARRCRCQSPDQRQRLTHSSRIPPRYQHCTIQGYVAADDELSKWKAKGE